MLTVLSGMASAVGGLPRRVTEFVTAHAGWLAAAVAVGLLGWAVSAVWWRGRARTELRSRSGVQWLPTAGFDPSVEAVERHAARLARVLAAAGWLPRRAAATRIRLSCVEGQLAYFLEGPERAAALLRLPVLAEVDVIDLGERHDDIPRIRFEGIAPHRTEDQSAQEQNDDGPGGCPVTDAQEDE